MRAHPTTLPLLALLLAACPSDPRESAPEDARPLDAGAPDAGPELCEYFALAFVPSTAMRPGLPCLDCHDEGHDTGERAMVGPVEHGNCNACHTAGGAMDAPGRIVAPAAVR